MTENIPKICAAFEIWQGSDCINAGTTLELIMRYLADDPEINYQVTDADHNRAYRDYLIRQNESLDAKMLIIRELNKDRVKDKVIIDGLHEQVGRTVRTAERTRNTTIDGLVRERDDLKQSLAAASIVIKDLESELSARKEDSKVLMKVVDVVKNWDGSYGRSFPTLIKTLDELVDYTDAPEGPPETPIDDLYKVTVSYAFLEMP